MHDTPSHQKAAEDEVEFLRTLLASRWRLRVLAAVRLHPSRLSQLRKQIPECSKKVLIDSLHALEKLGWIERIDLSSTGQPKHVEYRLSPQHQQRLVEVLDKLERP